MSISLGQPCDEGLVLRKEPPPRCTESSARWILVATILGSSMASSMEPSVNVGACEVAGESGCNGPASAMVMEAYSLLLACVFTLRRFARRSLRTAAPLSPRSGCVCLGISLVRPGTEYCSTHRGSSVARSWRRALVPGSLAIIGASFSEKSRGRAIGTWSAFTAITTRLVLSLAAG